MIPFKVQLKLYELYEALTYYTRTAQLQRRIESLENQFNLLKSSLEVPPEVVDEWFRWREQNPIPDEPLVSVVTATYNRARLLIDRCVASVLAQTYSNWEMIVIGDGCTDVTVEEMAKIEDPRVRFVNMEERGVYPADPNSRWMVAGTHAVNLGYSMVRGDFVTLLDDDDEYLPTRLEELVAFAKAENADFIWHPFYYQDQRGEWRVNDAMEFVYAQVTNGSIFYRSWFTRFRANMHCYLIDEPGDWARFRRIKYVRPVCKRYPEKLLRHYIERTQAGR